MKKTILFSVVMMAIGIFFSSCKKEQSQLTMDSIKGSAMIQGKVFYNEGAKQNSEGVIVLESIVPAAGQKVLVKVQYGDYVTGSAGTKIYETTIGSDGAYSISIPVAAKAVTPEVVVEPFKANHYVVVNGIVQTISNALYNVDNVGDPLTLNERDNKSCNLNVKTDEAAANTTLTNEITIKGSVNAKCEKVTETGSGSTATFAVANDGTRVLSCKAILKLEYTATDNGKLVDDRIIEYSFDIVAGKYTFTGKFYNGWEYDKVKATVSVQEFFVDKTDLANAFVHYYREVGSTLVEDNTDDFEEQPVTGTYGTYPATNDNGTLTFKSEILNRIYQSGVVPTIDLTLNFKPTDIYTIFGLGNPAMDKNEDDELEVANNNPMSWVLPVW